MDSNIQMQLTGRGGLGIAVAPTAEQRKAKELEGIRNMQSIDRAIANLAHAMPTSDFVIGGNPVQAFADYLQTAVDKKAGRKKSNTKPDPTDGRTILTKKTEGAQQAPVESYWAAPACFEYTANGMPSHVTEPMTAYANVLADIANNAKTARQIGDKLIALRTHHLVNATIKNFFAKSANPVNIMIILPNYINDITQDEALTNRIMLALAERWENEQAVDTGAGDYEHHQLRRREDIHDKTPDMIKDGRSLSCYEITPAYSGVLPELFDLGVEESKRAPYQLAASLYAASLTAKNQNTVLQQASTAFHSGSYPGDSWEEVVGIVMANSRPEKPARSLYTSEPIDINGVEWHVRVTEPRLYMSGFDKNDAGQRVVLHDIKPHILYEYRRDGDQYWQKAQTWPGYNDDKSDGGLPIEIRGLYMSNIVGIADSYDWGEGHITRAAERHRNTTGTDADMRAEGGIFVSAPVTTETGDQMRVVVPMPEQFAGGPVIEVQTLSEDFGGWMRYAELDAKLNSALPIPEEIKQTIQENITDIFYCWGIPKSGIVNDMYYEDLERRYPGVERNDKTDRTSDDNEFQMELAF